MLAPTTHSLTHLHAYSLNVICTQLGSPLPWRLEALPYDAAVAVLLCREECDFKHVDLQALWLTTTEDHPRLCIDYVDFVGRLNAITIH